MKTSRIPGRKSYASSGAVNWARFMPLYLLSLGVGGALAVVMHLLFRWGHYYIVLVPVLCALPVTGLGILAVTRGHCRSPLIGAVGGFIAGLVLYLGYYYAGMVDELGPDMAGKVHLLPDYIRWRKEIETTEDAHGPRHDADRPRQRDTGRTVLNWLIFSGELVGVLAVTISGPLRLARKPYCEGCKRWMTRELTRFEPDKGPALIEALRMNSPQSLAALFATSEYPSLPNTTVAVHYCPGLKEAVLRSCPPYLSLKTITANPQGATLDAFQSAKGTLLVDGAQLNPDELPALLSRFPTFQALTGQTAASALQQLGVRPEPPRDRPAAVADVRAVVPDYAGRVLTRRTGLVSAAIAFGTLLAMFGGLGLMVWGGTMAFPDKHSPRNVSPVEKVVGTTLLGLGGLAFLGISLTFFIDPSWLSNRYLRNVVRKEFSRRPAHLVDPNHPEATFVEVVPKLNWGKVKLESASDVGFLLLDRTRGEILFEGDKECYRVPAAAVTSCEVEVFVEGQGTHGATSMYYVVLRAHHAGGFWEAPIRKRGGTGMFLSGKRKRWAQGLRRDVLEMRDQPA